MPDTSLPADIPGLSGVLETSLYVADLARSQSFYQQVLGFTTMLSDPRMCALAVPRRQVLLLFLTDGSLQASPTPYGDIPPHGAHGTQHVCFSIPLGDLQRWENRLSAFGIDTDSRLVWPQGATSLYFRDPDGHSVELSTPGLWPNDPQKQAVLF